MSEFSGLSQMYNILSNLALKKDEKYMIASSQLLRVIYLTVRAKGNLLW